MTALHKVSHSSTHRAAQAASVAGRLVLGAAGPAVQELQAMLQKLGLYRAAIGGHFGKATLAAVHAFQKINGLKVDGWAGPITMGKLKKESVGSGVHSSFTPSSQPPSASGSAPVNVNVSGPASEKIASMLAWSKSKVGTPYAAVNPFRFGDVPWDGGRHTSVNGSGSSYQFPKGQQVFDCSGFVVASFRKLGIDLAAKGLASSGTINANAGGFLKNITKDQLQPGDLITYKPHDGVGHVMIYLGNGMMVQSSGGKGVNVAPVDWSRFQSARRVPVN